MYPTKTGYVWKPNLLSNIFAGYVFTVTEVQENYDRSTCLEIFYCEHINYNKNAID